MYSSEHIYFADYYSALLLAVASTVVFARTIRREHYLAWREVPRKLWLFAVCSWIIGVVIFFFAEVITHWVSVLAAIISLIIIGRALVRAARFGKETVVESDYAPNGIKATIALYFCVSAVLFFGTLFAGS